MAKDQPLPIVEDHNQPLINAELEDQLSSMSEGHPQSNAATLENEPLSDDVIENQPPSTLLEDQPLSSVVIKFECMCVLCATSSA